MSLQGSVQDPVLLNILSTELEARLKLATHSKTVVEIREQTSGAV